MTRILVTGARGFLGTHLVAELQAHGHDVTGVDLRDGDLANAGPAQYLIGRAQPDVVVHLAAQVGRLFGEQDAAFTIRTNAVATTLVAQACADAGAVLVYASTSEVYGAADDGSPDPEAEAWGHSSSDDNLDPALLPYNLYGLTKRWGEEAARLYAPEYLRILRFSMPYGPGLPPGRGRAAIVNMLAQAHKGEPIIVHRGAERSWCWIGDTVSGARLVIEEAFALRAAERIGAQWTDRDPEAFNVGRDDDPTSMLEVANLARLVVSDNGSVVSEIELVDPPANQVIVKRLPTAKLRSLGWEPRVGLADGMRRTYRAMLEAGHL